jgi:hypothetical protein
MFSAEEDAASTEEASDDNQAHACDDGRCDGSSVREIVADFVRIAAISNQILLFQIDWR